MVSDESGPSNVSRPIVPGPLAATRVVHSLPGRVRMRVPMWNAASHLGDRIQTVVSAQAGVIEVTANTRCNSVTVLYEPSAWNADSLCRFLQCLSAEELQFDPPVSATNAPSTSVLPVNLLIPWRFLYAVEGNNSEVMRTPAPEEMAKAGYWKAGYVCMIVGAVLVPVPFVPGIPFLLLSSYFFAKATVLKDGEEARARERESKEN